jgi:hypothetical protein
MRVGFVQPELRRLDEVSSDALCLCLHRDDWPLRGTPGLVDWRVCGHLSRLREAGWITCDEGEIVLMPLARRLRCERLLLVGMGGADRGELSDERIAAPLHQLFDALERMRIFATVLHLPGRPERVPPERAMEILLRVAEAHPNHDEVVVVETIEAQRAMERVLAGRSGASEA